MILIAAILNVIQISYLGISIGSKLCLTVPNFHFMLVSCVYGNCGNYGNVKAKIDPSEEQFWLNNEKMLVEEEVS